MAGRIIETMQNDGIFSGFVYQYDDPAPDHTVRIDITERTRKSVRSAHAKTATDGYFRMILSDVGKGETKKPTGLDDVVDKIARALYAEESAVKVKVDADTEIPTSQPPADGTINSRVQVVDPGGRVVHEDPVPPTFDGLGSEFRTYLLAAKGTDSSTPKPTRQSRKAR